MRFHLCTLRGTHALVHTPGQHFRDIDIMRLISRFRQPDCKAGDDFCDLLDTCRMEGSWPEPVILRLSKWVAYPNIPIAESLAQRICRTVFRFGSDTVRANVGGQSFITSSIPPRMLHKDDRLDQGIPTDSHDMFIRWALGYVVPAWGGTQPMPIPAFPDLRSARTYFTANP